jgi:hypothetical protein
MKHILTALILALSFQVYSQNKTSKVEQVIDSWHRAAADADLKAYQDFMTNDAVFIGTDPTEYWKGEDFINFAKPYFERGQAWTFYTLDRNIYNEASGSMVWFDELLDTQMGVCRGSGVLVHENGQWKIKHYVLSITIPNDNVTEIKELNNRFNKSFISSLKKN